MKGLLKSIFASIMWAGLLFSIFPDSHAWLFWVVLVSGTLFFVIVFQYPDKEEK